MLAIPKSSEAASLLTELENKDLKKLVPEADLPADGAQDAQWGQRCVVRIDRFGRRVRVCRPVRPRRRRCFWRIDRFGRRVQICR